MELVSNSCLVSCWCVCVQGANWAELGRGMDGLLESLRPQHVIDAYQDKQRYENRDQLIAFPVYRGGIR